MKLIVAFNQVPPSMVVEVAVTPVPLGLLNTPMFCEGGKLSLGTARICAQIERDDDGESLQNRDRRIPGRLALTWLASVRLGPATPRRAMRESLL